MRTAYIGGGGGGGGSAPPDGGMLLMGATGSTQGQIIWSGASDSYREGVGDILDQMRLLADPVKWSLPDAGVPEIEFIGVSDDYLVRCDIQIGLLNNPADRVMSAGIALNGDLVGGPIVSSAAMLAGCLPIKWDGVNECWLHAVRRVSLVAGDTLSLVLASSSNQEVIGHSINVSFIQVRPYAL